MPTILLTFAPAARALYYGDAALAALRALGDVRLHEDDEVLAGERLVAAARGCQFIVGDRRTAAPAALFESCPDLLAFLRCAMDIRTIDVDVAGAAGVLVTRASAGFGNAVAEWVIGAMIDLARGLSRSVHAYRSGAAPAIAMGRELRGAALGVIGYGTIGRRVAALGLALGMRVVVADPHAPIDEAALEPAELDALLAQSDFVVCLAPARPETENLIDAARLARFKRGACFVNAARGELVDEPALLRALDDGRLAGCALDVGRAPDQMPSPALARHPLVVATPHIGGLTPPAAGHQAQETVAQLGELLRGGMPAGAVNAAQARRLEAWRAHRA